MNMRRFGCRTDARMLTCTRWIQCHFRPHSTIHEHKFARQCHNKHPNSKQNDRLAGAYQRHGDDAGSLCAPRAQGRA